MRTISKLAPVAALLLFASLTACKRHRTSEVDAAIAETPAPEETAAATATAPPTPSAKHATPTTTAKPRVTGGSGAATADAPCPGPGLTRRCGGRCVNLQTDDSNCGSCGTVCSGGKHCDGHLSCRDSAGNL